MEEFSTEWFSPLEEGEERQNPKPPEDPEKEKRKKLKQLLTAVAVTVGIVAMIIGIIIGYAIGFARGEASAKLAATVDVTKAVETEKQTVDETMESVLETEKIAETAKPAETEKIVETEPQTEETETESETETEDRSKTIKQLIEPLGAFFTGKSSTIDLGIDGLQDALRAYDPELVSLAGLYSGTTSEQVPAYAISDLDGDGTDELILKAGSPSKGESVVGVITMKAGTLNFAGLPSFDDVMKSLGNPESGVYEKGVYFSNGKIWYKIRFDYNNSTDSAWVAFELKGLKFKLADECYVSPGLDTTAAYHMRHPLTLDPATKRPIVDADAKQVSLKNAATGERAIDAEIGEDSMEWHVFK